MRNLILIIVAILYFQSDSLMGQSKHDHHCMHRKAQMLQQERSMAADNSRSDTLDVLHYQINLDFTEMDNSYINGSCLLEISSKIDGLEEVLLDLQGLEVSNVIVDGNLVNFEYNSPLLKIELDSPMNIGDTFMVDVLYSGYPETAVWGGFYFTGDYAFNLGVGIGADPPTFGRVWFPCVDNFAERSSYAFNITTLPEYKAFCNGTLNSETINGDGNIIWNWELEQEIPTYLASVAVGQYETIEWSFENSAGEEIPIQLGALANDVNSLENAFVHLPENLTAFEEAFGPYQWDRVGYVLVPFNAGAMEHATNIAYPRSFIIGGQLSYEAIMAHELAHHWWGDLVTCETASDMWLNEGWASYCEYLFFEKIYDKERYKSEQRSNHEYVLVQLPVDDGGFFSVANVPFDLTYSPTVYNKGADVIHTMRSYMGDEQFFACTTSFLEENAWQNMNSEGFRDYLTDCSGIDMTDYFNDWIFNPGFPHFSIDSTQVEDLNNGAFLANVHIRQRLYGAPDFYSNVPIEITFMNDDLDEEFTARVYADGQCSIHPVELPFEPVYVGLDIEERINDATIDRYLWIDEEGEYMDDDETNVSLIVEEAQTATFVRVINNMVMPDRFEEPIEDIIISDSHYWKIEIVAPEGNDFEADAIFTYNGSTTNNSGYYDNSLFSVSENNLQLLYREDSSQDWELADDFDVDTGTNINDKRGTITLSNVEAGEYVLAIEDPDRVDGLETAIPSDCQEVVANEQLFQLSQINIGPNPSDGLLNINLSASKINIFHLQIFNNKGQLIEAKTLTNQAHQLDLSNYHTGLYIIQLSDANGQFHYSEKVMKVD